MDSFSAKYSEMYDVLYSDKDYISESIFVTEFLTKNDIPRGSNILDLACGTGNYAFQLEKAGYNVVGVDLSPNMIRVANRKKNALSSGCFFYEGDMRELHLLKLGRKFDAVICLFDSLGFVVSNEALSDTLKGVKEVLKDGGLFIFDVWHAAAMIKHSEKTRVKRINSGDKEIIRISETDIDVVKQTGHVHYSMFIREHGKFDIFEDEQENRFFLVQELKAILDNAAIVPIGFYNGFTFDKVVNDDTWHITCCAKNSI